MEAPWSIGQFAMICDSAKVSNPPSNLKELEAYNICLHHGDSLDILKQNDQKFDWIYADPARRDEHGSKVYHLSDCTPDIPEELDFLLEKSDHIWLRNRYNSRPGFALENDGNNK